MTKDHARKNAIRARMAATGEPYSVAARRLGGAGYASDTEAISKIAACARSTVAAPSARMQVRRDWEIRPGPRPGLIGRLARRVGRAAWDRFSSEMSLSEAREVFMHQVGQGFLEPAAGRYQVVVDGTWGEMAFDGNRYAGGSGRPVSDRYLVKAGERHPGDPIVMLRQLNDVTDARFTGAETVRGVSCQVADVRAGSAEFTVWTGGGYIRRVRFVERSARQRSPAMVSRTHVLELWDIGVRVGSPDWSRLPGAGTADSPWPGAAAHDDA